MICTVHAKTAMHRLGQLYEAVLATLVVLEPMILTIVLHEGLAF
jgi:hypothetical protein